MYLLKDAHQNLLIKRFMIVFTGVGKTAEDAAADARAAALSQSFTTLQEQAMRKVDLDAQIQTTAFMTVRAILT